MVSSVADRQSRDIDALVDRISELQGKVILLERKTRQMQHTINELSAGLRDSRGDEVSAGSQTWKWRGACMKRRRTTAQPQESRQSDAASSEYDAAATQAMA